MRFIVDGMVYSEHFSEGQTLLRAWIVFKKSKQSTSARYCLTLLGRFPAASLDKPVHRLNIIPLERGESRRL